MALGDPYSTLTELKTYIGVDEPDDIDDEVLTQALDSASQGIEDFTRRQFNTATVASARPYRAHVGGYVEVDDFHTADGLVVATDDDGDGLFETTWTPGEFELYPLGGVRNGRPGWPFTEIRAVGARRFPQHERAAVQITAVWGWAAVPGPVVQACLLLAAEAGKLKDAPLGVAGWSPDFGPVRVRDNPIAKAKLRPYCRYWAGVG